MGALARGKHCHRARRRAIARPWARWRAASLVIARGVVPSPAHGHPRHVIGLFWVPLGHWHGHTTYVLLNWGFRGIFRSLALAFAWPRDSLGLVLGMGVFDLGLERHDTML